MASLLEELEETRVSLLQQMEEKEEEARRSQLSALLEAQSEARAALQRERDTLARSRSEWEGLEAALRRELEAARARWLARESRPEDVARMRQLEQECLGKDALVRKTMQDMAYFKRELLNREDMYNKNFGAKPVVGVMNVLKDARGAGGLRRGVGGR